MDIDDGLGLHQLLAQLFNLPFKFSQPTSLFVPWIGFTPALAGGECFQDTRLALLSPCGQVGGVQPLTPQ